MVNVGVGQKYVVNVAVTDRKFRILVRIVPLLHTTVNKDFCISYFQKMTAACNFMVCSDKGQFHKHSPLCCPFLLLL